MKAEQSGKDAQGNGEESHQKEADDDHLTEKHMSRVFLSAACCFVETDVVRVATSAFVGSALKEEEGWFK